MAWLNHGLGLLTYICHLSLSHEVRKRFDQGVTRESILILFIYLFLWGVGEVSRCSVPAHTNKNAPPYDRVLPKGAVEPEVRSIGCRAGRLPQITC